MLATDAPRLPGVIFEREPPPPTPLLPRMDIAAFVGFAERGPLDTPVPVEDMARFTDVFGEEVRLAWDPELGEPLRGHLRAAVKAFFRNGGKRCWVIRVAGALAESAEFPVAGLLRCEPDRTAGREWDSRLVPARLVASSKGPWADAYVAAASITNRQLELGGRPAHTRVPDDADGHSVIALPLTLGRADDLSVGDVLRLDLRGGRIGFVAVNAITRAGGDGQVTAVCERHVWFRRTQIAPGSDGVAAYTDGSGRTRAARARVVSPPPGSDDLTLAIEAVDGEWPVPGSWVRFSLGRRRWWLAVREAAAELDPQAGAELTRVSGEGLRRNWPTIAALEQSYPEVGVEQLRLTLWSGRQGSLTDRRADIGLAPGHQRFLGDLPADEQLFGAEPWQPLGAGPTVSGFPLASAGQPGFYVPLFVPPEPYWPSNAVVRTRSALDRAGLSELSPVLFVDQALGDRPVTSLIGEADYIRYQSPSPRRLRGIHAALEIDEASIIAVPDAGQPMWSAHWPIRATPSIETQSPPPASDDDFEVCETGPLATPEPMVERDARNERKFAIKWSPVDGANAYFVEQTREPESWMPALLEQTTGTGYPLSHVAPGTYRYRVQAIGAGSVSGWSEPVQVTVDTMPAYTVDEEQDGAMALAIQGSLLRLCAARGDLFAVVSPPEGMSAPAVLDYAAALRAAAIQTGVERPGAIVSPDSDPGAVLSYAGLYHPWLLTAVDAAERSTGVVECSPIVAGSRAGRLDADRQRRAADPRRHGAALPEGELQVQGPNVMRGYWKDPERTAEVLHDGWYSTGDLARLDERGNIFLAAAPRS